MKKQLVILGSTGSIGRQALKVVDLHPELLEITALAANKSAEELLGQILRYHPKKACLVDEAAASSIAEQIPDGTELLTGKQALVELAQMEESDICLIAVVGIAGLEATLAAAKAGKRIALANKETLVTGGTLVKQAVGKYHAELLPVDSEHGAIFQCIAANKDRGAINRIWLTASGGPFREYSAEQLRTVTVEDALRHPNWAMGPKITIDSATLMNKGLEVIEACHLFDVTPDQVEVVVHPKSLVHSGVELADHSVLVQMGAPDMTIPIQYALLYPERLPSPAPALDLFSCGDLHFERPDTERFPCLRLAFDAMRAGGAAPTLLNGANEIAVARFLRKEIGFTDIPRIVEKVLAKEQGMRADDLGDIWEADRVARALAAEY